ncbi:hypothetical protein [Lysinibacillus pakistanensis]|uniref:hypothetical protein n=1 Tax=Lysinibacillus pakistanensis TaxID=759811 RepID=UPI003D2C558F
MFGKQNLNVEYGNLKVKDVATKVGSLFGPKGKTVGEKVDLVTKKITIKIEK